MKPTLLRALILLTLAVPGRGGAADASLVRSARSGPWSAADTWEGGKIPAAGTRVQVRSPHVVLYDVNSTAILRSIHVAGTLTFAPDQNTQLNVGLVKIQPGDDASEDGFNCDAHVRELEPGQARPALEVGTPHRPIDATHAAVIRLHHVEGMDRESCPAIVCCGGRMDLHGAPLNRTWLKLGAPANKGDAVVKLAEAVSGWRPGDRVILTATTRQIKAKKTFRDSVRDNTQTEERILKGIDGVAVTLDKPLAHEHVAVGSYRGDVANLSRNVIIESADAKGVRGHVMYHRGSTGSISYAEFRHLGKPGVLGRYSLHYHLVGNTMRGSSVVGASIWDSGNRWLTIHGTNYLVVRDCVGYQSLGHGYFFEDGTEVCNVLDRNLAVQAYATKPLPKQVLTFDKNDGAGFWWANSLNTFTRNTACECDEYGYFFQATKTADFDPVLPIQHPDAGRKSIDVRTLPFVRFEDNESHCQRRHAFNLGGGVPFGPPNVGGVGPDEKHPFLIRNVRIWNVHWAFHPVAPSVFVDQMDVYQAEYAIWRPTYKQHAYRQVQLDQITVSKEFAPTGTKPPDDAVLTPVDDLAPITVITFVGRPQDGRVVVRGTTSDNGTVKRVVVNGREAKASRDNFAEWEVVLEGVKPGTFTVSASGEDASGNVEKRSHVVMITVR